MSNKELPTLYNKVTDFLAFITVTILGLSAGAMLTEAVVFVQFWQSMSPENFLKWFSENESLLTKFFGTIQTISAVLILITTVLFWLKGTPAKFYSLMSTVLIIAVLLTFFLYFKEANHNFSTFAVPLNEVKAKLSDWSFWQWVRTALGVSAFVFSILALTKKENI